MPLGADPEIIRKQNPEEERLCRRRAGQREKTLIWVPSHYFRSLELEQAILKFYFKYACIFKG